MAEAGQSSAQQALYPPPPVFYRLYRQDADGTAERPLPPEPPAPAQTDYQLFGEMHTVRLSADTETFSQDLSRRMGAQRRLSQAFRLFR